MPASGPLARRELIVALRGAGFDGPYTGTDHQFMAKGPIQVNLPNPHRGDISVSLVAKIVRQAHISREEWERL